jgi:hypothetical protein
MSIDVRSVVLGDDMCWDEIHCMFLTSLWWDTMRLYCEWCPDLCSCHMTYCDSAVLHEIFYYKWYSTWDVIWCDVTYLRCDKGRWNVLRGLFPSFYVSKMRINSSPSTLLYVTDEMRWDAYSLPLCGETRWDGDVSDVLCSIRTTGDLVLCYLLQRMFISSGVVNAPSTSVLTPMIRGEPENPSVVKYRGNPSKEHTTDSVTVQCRSV